MSRKPAAIPLFADAYMADTAHLTLEEDGAYLRLMMIAWRSDGCRLADDDKRLARMLGIGASKWAKLKPVVMAFWTLADGFWTQGRLSKERQFIEEKVATNSASAKSRWGKQPSENKQSDECERISERNAPPPLPPKKEEEPNGSPSPPTPTKAKRGIRKSGEDHPLPEDWKPKLGPETAAMVAGWPDGDFASEEFRFRNHAIAHGRLAKNWNAAFAMWLSNGDDRRKGNGHGIRNQPPRDNRDGAVKAAQRRIAGTGFEQPPGETGRFDPGDGGGDRVIPIARARPV